jgi:hypothetical protein
VRIIIISRASERRCFAAAAGSLTDVVKVRQPPSGKFRVSVGGAPAISEARDIIIIIIIVVVVVVYTT